MNGVLGVDAGGTSSRAALFTPDGTLVRRGHAAGANPGALGMDRAAANLTAAVRAALGSAQVSAVVIGLAGHPDRCRSLTERVFPPLVPEAAPVRIVGDVVTAFAAGTSSPSGTVLISGTGAIAAKIIDHRPVATADGFGWQLGDEGSAFWLGRAAARATIRTLATARGGDRSGGGLLAVLVVRHLLPGSAGGDAVAELAAAVHARSPLALAELAPLVSEAARGGDPVAVSIVAEAASRLAKTASEVHEPGLPIVLAGGVLTADGPVREAVQGHLEGAVTAGDPAGAAAWLAARPFLDPRESEARHPRFTRPR
ncbi:N-acetylglucosamine kinase [Nonomuraea sp. M3C6]|uniref:N-acetylglucosamine kinase n=1 Tax=Nonomuraea marmarensis TaxID=3351344 RepID=A0ABW7A7I9_9ACTN